MNSLKIKISAFIALSAFATTTTPAFAAEVPVYMETVAAGATLQVLTTAGDKIGGYQVMGIPDGLGVLKSGNTLKIYNNLELSASNAVAAARKTANGAASGATVSESILDLATGKVTAAKDFIKTVTWYDYAKKSWGSTPGAPAGSALADQYGTPNHGTIFNRFCSSSISQPGALSYVVSTTTGTGKKQKTVKTTYGYDGAVYFTGEEGGDESRGFVIDQDGNMVQIPAFGLASWENFLLAPTAKGLKTVVIGDEDGSATNSQLSLYIGTKTTTGPWYERAGFTNGKKYVLSADKVVSLPNDNIWRKYAGKNAPTAVTFEEINWNASGPDQSFEVTAKGMEFARIEDGSFDPKNPNDYYFVTTESNKDPLATAPNPALPTVSRDGGALWKLSFTDINDPLKGAILTMLLDGSEAPYLSKPDNITVDLAGNILIQEDPGGNDAVSRLVAYRISDGKVGVVAKFVDKYFKPGGSEFMTNDEESSGVIEITDFYKKSATDTNRYYMYDAQVHTTLKIARPDITDTAAQTALADSIEGGQLYILTIADWSKVYA